MKKLSLCALVCLGSSALGMPLNSCDDIRCTQAKALEYLFSHVNEETCATIKFDEQGQPTSVANEYSCGDISLNRAYVGICGNFCAVSWQDEYQWQTRVFKLVGNTLQGFPVQSYCARCFAIADDGTMIIGTTSYNGTTNLQRIEPCGKRGIEMCIGGDQPQATRDGCGYAGTCEQLQITAIDFCSQGKTAYSWNLCHNLLVWCIRDAKGIHQFCFGPLGLASLSFPVVAAAIPGVMNNLPVD